MGVLQAMLTLPLILQGSSKTLKRNTEIAVAVDARLRQQCGEAIEQFQRGEDRRATGAGAAF